MKFVNNRLYFDSEEVKHAFAEEPQHQHYIDVADKYTQEQAKTLITDNPDFYKLADQMLLQVQKALVTATDEKINENYLALRHFTDCFANHADGEVYNYVDLSRYDPAKEKQHDILVYGNDAEVGGQGQKYSAELFSRNHIQAVLHDLTELDPENSALLNGLAKSFGVKLGLFKQEEFYTSQEAMKICNTMNFKNASTFIENTAIVALDRANSLNNAEGVKDHQVIQNINSFFTLLDKHASREISVESRIDPDFMTAFNPTRAKYNLSTEVMTFDREGTKRIYPLKEFTKEFLRTELYKARTIDPENGAAYAAIGSIMGLDRNLGQGRT